MPVYYDSKGKYYYIRMYITNIFGKRSQKRFGNYCSKSEAKLAEANEEDYMWVSGIYYMANASGIDINLLNLQSQRILEKRDF